MKIRLVIVISAFLLSSLNAQRKTEIGGCYYGHEIAPNGKIHLFTQSCAKSPETSIHDHLVDVNDFSVTKYCARAFEWPLAPIVFPDSSTFALIESRAPGGQGALNFISMFSEDCTTLYSDNFQKAFEPLRHSTAFGGKIYSIPESSSELLTISVQSEILRRDTLLIPLDEIDFMNSAAVDKIRITNFKDNKIFVIDTSGNLINEYSSELIRGKYFKKGNNYYSLKKKSTYEYGITGIDSIGRRNFGITLRDSCRKCIYNDFVISENGNIFLVGGVHQFNGFEPIPGPGIPWYIYTDRDVLVSKFDPTGKLLERKIYDDKKFSEVGSAHLTKNGELFLFSVWDADRDVLGGSEYTAIIRTDLNLSGLSKFAYQFPDTARMTDTTVIIDTTIIIDTLPTGEEITFKIGPNPAREFFKIKSSHPNKKIRFTLRDLRGVLVREETFKDELVVDTHNLIKGVYFYNLASPESEFEVYHGRIVIYK